MQNQVFQTEKLKRLTLYGIITLLVLLITLLIMLQTTYIQTKITNYITKELSSKLKSDIHIDNVNISLFKGFKIEGILIKDIQNDTMLYIKKLYTLPSGIPTDLNNLSFRFIEINELYFDLHEIKKDTLNLDYMINAITSENDTSKSEDFRLRVGNLKLHNSVFKYKEIDSISSPGMDYEDMDFSNINVEIDDIDINNSRINTKVKKISLKEKSGFVVKNISTESNSISPEKIHIKDLKIITDKSRFEFDSINLIYPERYLFSPYKTDLNLQASFKKGSVIAYSDLSIFLQDSVKQLGKLYLSGYIKGKYNDIYLSGFSLNAENVLSLKTDSHIKNLSDPENMDFDLNISELRANLQRISDLKIPGKTKSMIRLPEELRKIDIVTYTGITKGNSKKFKSDGIISGDFGKITLDANARKDTNNIIGIKGKIYGENLDIGTAVENPDFGKSSFEQTFDLSFLKNKTFKISTGGNIANFMYKNHNYKDIKLFASFHDKISDSLLVRIERPELNAEIIGSGDFSENIPKIYAVGKIHHADLQAMSLSSKPTGLSAEFTGNFEGISIDDFTGTIRLNKPLIYKEDSLTTVISELNLTGKSQIEDSVKTKYLNLESDIVDAELKSTGSISASVKSLKRVFDNIFKTTRYEPIEKDTLSNAYLDFKVNIKKSDVLTSLFFPDIKIKQDSKIFGFYQPSSDKFNMSFNSDEFKYKDASVKDFYIIAYTRDNKLYTGTGGSKVKPSEKFYAENLNFGSEIKKDTINFNLTWNNFKDSANYSADITGSVNIRKNKHNKLSYYCKFSKSNIILNDILWNFNNAAIKVDTSHINISDLRVKHNDEEVYLDGNISKYEGDILFATFKNLNLSNFQPLISKDLSLNGKLSGFSTVAGLYSDPLFFTKDSIVDLDVNNMSFGNFHIKSFWDNAENNIRANAYNLKGKRRLMNDTIYGNYNPKSQEIDFTVDIRSMLLKTFQDYYNDFADFNPTAFFTGKIYIKGKINKPDISGDLNIKQTTAYIKYLNTYNNLGELKLKFDKQNILINKTKMIAGNGKGSGYISGSIHHKNFSDFYLDIDIQANNYELLNIIPTDSSYYYGQAFGSGNINFSGPLNDIFMSADLQTDRNTNIYIPISSDKTYSEENSFISFKTDTIIKVQNKEEINIQPNVSGFSMNMKLNVTPDALIQILPGESLGNIYTQGEGGISLVLEKNGDFNVFGTYNITKGNYQFNIENIIQKDFTITEGSTIDWFGDPQNATVNIKAAYVLNNVSLSDLTLDPEESRRAQINCVINITGKLLNPEFDLNVIFPKNLNEYTAKINNLASNDLNEQFLSLLLLGIFQPLPGINQENIAGKPATGELLSKQLNSFLRKIKYVDLNFNYDPGNNNYTNEYTVGISKSFLDDRVEVKGNFGVGGQEIQQTGATNYIGEFELEAKLNPKGTVRAKVYNKANDKIENDGNYTQGVGFIWRRDFDYLFIPKANKRKDTLQLKPELNDSIK